MTGISPASSGASGVSMGAMSGENSRLKALEQKLGKLEKEKEKAAKAHNKDKERELEKEIQKVKQQIGQLKAKEGKKQEQQEEEEKEEKDRYGQKVPDEVLGNMVDVYG